MKKLIHLLSNSLLSLCLLFIFILAALSCKPEEEPIIRVSGITLNVEELSMVEGDTFKLIATISPSSASNKSITWSSSNASIASVENGTVTAIKEGVATIFATSVDGIVKTSCVVTVSAKYIAVESITLSKSEIEMNVGEQETITALIKPDNATNKSVAWTTDNSSVATIKDGVITAIGAGKTTIRATVDETTATCIVTVTKQIIEVTDITLDINALELNKGEYYLLTATVSPNDATDKTVTWVSLDEGIAIVDENGKVTGISGGYTTVTAKAGAKEATCSVLVKVPVTDISLDSSSLSLGVGDTATLIATVSPEDASDKSVIWNSSNPSVVSVDNGRITAKEEGTAIISASAGDKTATCSITVTSLYLTFSTNSTTTLSIENYGGNQPVLYYSKDKIHWNKWDYSSITFSVDSPVYMYGKNPNGFSNETKYSTFTAAGALFKVTGNIMSLIDRDEKVTTIPSSNCFYSLFANCYSLSEAPELPATTLASGCYSNMFEGCSALTRAPELPASALANYCYFCMFSGCTNLKTAPKVLPAISLTECCYAHMFENCTNLTTAPDISAKTLATACCEAMFVNCTSLTKAPTLPATTLADFCYEGMFGYCTDLTVAPALPATTLKDHCYESMFACCTNLIIAPELPATTLAKECYQYMFSGCTNLKTAPKVLPAISLSDNCYEGMFKDCTNLTTAPDISAITLATACCQEMFFNCTSLTKAPTLPATTLAQSCYLSMFSDCTSLTTATELPATTLAQSCYHSMYRNCKSLTAAPSILPATTLAKHCYREMFDNCPNLKTAPELPATTMAMMCYCCMFQDCTSLNYVKCLAIFKKSEAGDYMSGMLGGVASSGIFIKAATMTLDDWWYGKGGIPNGWTVMDAEE